MSKSSTDNSQSSSTASSGSGTSSASSVSAKANASNDTNLRPRKLQTGNTVRSASYVWLQPTTVVDAHLVTADKQKYMTEDIMTSYRKAFLTTKAALLAKTTVDTTGLFHPSSYQLTSHPQTNTSTHTISYGTNTPLSAASTLTPYHYPSPPPPPPPLYYGTPSPPISCICWERNRGRGPLQRRRLQSHCPNDRQCLHGPFPSAIHSFRGRGHCHQKEGEQSPKPHSHIPSCRSSRTPLVPLI